MCNGVFWLSPYLSVMKGNTLKFPVRRFESLPIARFTFYITNKHAIGTTRFPLLLPINQLPLGTNKISDSSRQTQPDNSKTPAFLYIRERIFSGMLKTLECYWYLVRQLLVKANAELYGRLIRNDINLLQCRLKVDSSYRTLFPVVSCRTDKMNLYITVDSANVFLAIGLQETTYQLIR